VDYESVDKNGNKVKFSWNYKSGRKYSQLFYLGLVIVATIGLLLVLSIWWGIKCRRGRKRRKSNRKEKGKRKRKEGHPTEKETDSPSSMKTMFRAKSSRPDEHESRYAEVGPPSIQTIDSRTGLTREGKKPKSTSLPSSPEDSAKSTQSSQKKRKYDVGSPRKTRSPR